MTYTAIDIVYRETDKTKNGDRRQPHSHGGCRIGYRENGERTQNLSRNGTGPRPVRRAAGTRHAWRVVSLGCRGLLQTVRHAFVRDGRCLAGGCHPLRIPLLDVSGRRSGCLRYSAKKHSRAVARAALVAGGRRSAPAWATARDGHRPARPVPPRPNGILLAGQTSAVPAAVVVATGTVVAGTMAASGGTWAAHGRGR